MAVWSEVSGALNKQLNWEGLSLLEAFSSWCANRCNYTYRALPCIISWGIWLARNKIIFQDNRSSPATVAAHGVAIMSHFTQHIQTRQARIVRVEDIDIGRPWGYFDGSS